ncbi:MAG: hypothetical protein R3D02_03910 [Hyphomicrobiales bacterium]
MKQIRLIPLVVFAAAALLVLKTIALVGEGGYVLTGTVGARAANDGAATEAPADPAAADAAAPAGGTPAPLADLMAGEGDPASSPLPDGDMAGMAGPSGDAGMAGMASSLPVAPVFGEKIDLNAKSAAEQALLSRLGDRRKELEKREAQIKLRESLLQAAEKRLEERLNQLKGMEATVEAAAQKKQEDREAEIGRLISMYESMKPKDAARVFDRLSIDILVDLVRKMNPRKMALILAQMSPEAAEKLTVEMATQGKGIDKTDAGPHELPKIEGRPIPPGES